LSMLLAQFNERAAELQKEHQHQSSAVSSSELKTLLSDRSRVHDAVPDHTEMKATADGGSAVMQNQLGRLAYALCHDDAVLRTIHDPLDVSSTPGEWDLENLIARVPEATHGIIPGIVPAGNIPVKGPDVTRQVEMQPEALGYNNSQSYSDFDGVGLMDKQHRHHEARLDPTRSAGADVQQVDAADTVPYAHSDTNRRHAHDFNALKDALRSHVHDSTSLLSRDVSACMTASPPETCTALPQPQHRHQVHCSSPDELSTMQTHLLRGLLNNAANNFSISLDEDSMLFGLDRKQGVQGTVHSNAACATSPLPDSSSAHMLAPSSCTPPSTLALQAQLAAPAAAWPATTPEAAQTSSLSNAINHHKTLQPSAIEQRATSNSAQQLCSLRGVPEQSFAATPQTLNPCAADPDQLLTAAPQNVLQPVSCAFSS
jgi:hypothetical protein